VYALKLAFTPQSRARRATFRASRKLSAWRTVVSDPPPLARGGQTRAWMGEEPGDRPEGVVAVVGVVEGDEDLVHSRLHELGEPGGREERPVRVEEDPQRSAARLQETDEAGEVGVEQRLAARQDGDDRAQRAADIDEPLRRRPVLDDRLAPVAVTAAGVAVVGELEGEAPRSPQQVAGEPAEGERPRHGSPHLVSPPRHARRPRRRGGRHRRLHRGSGTWASSMYLSALATSLV
jgi:hypothetical protein